MISYHMSRHSDFIPIRGSTDDGVPVSCENGDPPQIGTPGPHFTGKWGPPVLDMYVDWTDQPSLPMQALRLIWLAT